MLLFVSYSNLADSWYQLRTIRISAWLLDLIYQYSLTWYLAQMCVISVPKRWPPRSIPERARFDSPIYLLLAVFIALVCMRYLAGY